ncbi:hypothetical protein QW131_16265 [Roseibium salinum]|nr:hypothetical protein [Roseibium salinum]
MQDSFRFPTGAVGGWTSTQEVQNAGHPALVLVDDDDLNLKVLKSGNTRLWLGGLLSAPYVAKQEGVEIENVYTIREIDLSLACNPATDKSVTGRLQSALDSHLSTVAGRTPERNPMHLTQ